MPLQIVYEVNDFTSDKWNSLILSFSYLAALVLLKRNARAPKIESTRKKNVLIRSNSGFSLNSKHQTTNISYGNMRPNDDSAILLTFHAIP